MRNPPYGSVSIMERKDMGYGKEENPRHQQREH